MIIKHTLKLTKTSQGISRD